MRGALFVAALGLFLALAPAAPPAGLARTVRASAQALATTGRLDVAAAAEADTLPETAVRHGRRRPTTALGAIAALTPAEALAAALAAADARGRVALLLETVTAAVPAALVCVLFFGLLRRQAIPARRALVFTALLALATPLSWYARVADGTALATLLLLAASAAARTLAGAAPVDARAERRAATALGLTLGALVLVEPTLVWTALAPIGWCAWQRRARLDGATAARVLAPLAAAVVLVLGWRQLAGARPPLPGALGQGLDGLLLSTGKSLFVYAPPLLLAPPALVWLWRRERAHAQLVLVTGAALLLSIAPLDDWHGDPTWGPRRAIPLVPLLLEPVALAWPAAATRARRAILGATAVAGLWVQLVGIAIAPQRYLEVVDQVRVQSGAASWFGETPSECHFIPQLSPVVGHTWLLSHLLRHDPRFEVDPPYLLLIDQPPRLEAVAAQLYIDSWLRTWPPLAAELWLGIFVAVIGSAAWTMRRRLV